MLLQPKKLKFKKTRKGKLKKFKHNKNLVYGNIGLKSLESGYITSKQIEASRQSINRKIKRSGKIWIRIFPNTPITKKPLETRMGKGKGSVDHWASKVSGGTVLFELCGISHKKAFLALKTGSAKLPIKTSVIY
jgi:large subunit ribosomal protein L16